ncbi:MAG TPA: DUF6034 family protein [Clostridia bacterium]|nr:DUF6034 family protein [Clostridia bacterium]
MNKKTYMILFVFCLSCMFFACKPTPASDPIVNKNEDNLSNDLPVMISAPDVVTIPANITGNVSVEVDATVHYTSGLVAYTYDTAKYPFRSSILSNLCNYCSPDCSLYVPWEDTKNEIKEKLSAWMDYSGEGGSFIEESLVKNDIENLQKAYDSASDSPNLSEYHWPDDAQETAVSLYGVSATGEKAVFKFIYGGNQFSYARQNDIYIYPEAALQPQDKAIEEPLISEAHALEYLKNFLNAFEISDYRVVNTTKALVLRYGQRQESSWKFTLSREINQTMTITAFEDVYISKASLPSVGAPWSVESLTMIIDSKGILSLIWQGASLPSKPVQAHALAFDEIVQRATNQMGYQYAAMENDGKMLYVKIKDFSLKYAMISRANNADEAIYVPVWEVTYDRGWDNADEEWKFYLSALDGSYIEPRVTNRTIQNLGS